MGTFALFLVILAAAFVFMGVTVVRQGYRYTIEYFGKFVATAEPLCRFHEPSLSMGPDPKFSTAYGRRDNTPPGNEYVHPPSS